MFKTTVGNNKLKYVLLYSHENDPISNILLNNKKLFKNLFYIHIKDLLDEGTEIFDRINLEKIDINWVLPKLNLELTSNSLIINRILNIEKNWFCNFENKYKRYAISEFWAYLVFALNAFNMVNARPGAHCLMGNNMPLPMLWKKAQLCGAKTPNFFLGVFNKLPKKLEKSQIIIKNSLYDYYFWKPNFINEFKQNTDQSLFATLRPTGFPLLVTQIENLMSLQILDNSVNLSDNKEEYKSILNNLKKVAVKIHKRNQYWCSESLFFVNIKKGEFTFAMMNNYMYGSQACDPNFIDNLLKKLKTLFS